jgi:hypothetical protein
MMAKISDELREVAERLRQMADAHDATEASRVAHALELEYKVYGTVVAFDSADIWSLADLIDPTCQMKSIPEPGYRVCSRCGAFVRNDAATNCTEAIPVRFCPNCGASVVSDDD